MNAKHVVLILIFRIDKYYEDGSMCNFCNLLVVFFACWWV